MIKITDLYMLCMWENLQTRQCITCIPTVCTLFKRDRPCNQSGLKTQQGDPKSDNLGVAGIQSLAMEFLRKMRRMIALTLPNCLILMGTFQEPCLTLMSRTQTLPTVNMATFSEIIQQTLKSMPSPSIMCS